MGCGAPCRDVQQVKITLCQARPPLLAVVTLSYVSLDLSLRLHTRCGTRQTAPKPYEHSNRGHMRAAGARSGACM